MLGRLRHFQDFDAVADAQRRQRARGVQLARQRQQLRQSRRVVLEVRVGHRSRRNACADQLDRPIGPAGDHRRIVRVDRAEVAQQQPKRAVGRCVVRQVVQLDDVDAVGRQRQLGPRVAPQEGLAPLDGDRRAGDGFQFQHGVEPRADPPRLDLGHQPIVGVPAEENAALAGAADQPGKGGRQRRGPIFGAVADQPLGQPVERNAHRVAHAARRKDGERIDSRRRVGRHRDVDHQVTRGRAFDERLLDAGNRQIDPRLCRRADSPLMLSRVVWPICRPNCESDSMAGGSAIGLTGCSSRRANSGPCGPAISRKSWLTSEADSARVKSRNSSITPLVYSISGVLQPNVSGASVSRPAVFTWLNQTSRLWMRPGPTTDFGSGRLAVDEQPGPHVGEVGIVAGGRLVVDFERGRQVHEPSRAQNFLGAVAGHAKAAAVVDVQLKDVAGGDVVDAVVRAARPQRSLGQNPVGGGVRLRMQADEEEAERDGVGAAGIGDVD